MKLSQIKQVPVKSLKINPENHKYFREMGGKEYDSLYENIKKNGIQVPLIATKEGILLSGHTRLSIAKDLNLKTVPVRFHEKPLSKSQEVEYMINDNLLRRHLQPEDRKQLYQIIFKNFNQRVLRKYSKDSITADLINKKTGIPKSTAARDVDMIRREAEKSMVLRTPEERRERVLMNYRQNITKVLNFAMLEDQDFIKECIKTTETVLQRFHGMRK